MINYFGEEVALKRATLKKDIKKTAGKCAKMLLTLGITTQVLAYVIYFIIIIRGSIIGAGMTANKESGTAFGMPKEVVDFLTAYLPCILGDIIAIIIGMKITKVKIKSHMFCKNKSNAKFIGLGALSCLGIGIVSQAIYLIYESILKHFGITIPSPDFNFPQQNPLILTLILSYVCVLGPIFEEIIFRGFILKSMQQYGNLTAIIVTSILFSMFHLNLVQFVPPVLIGMLLAIITIKSESIIPSIIAHMFNNTVMFAIGSVQSTPLFVQSLVSMLYISSAVLGLAFFIKAYGREIIQIVKDNTKILKIRQKVVASFTGGWSIAYIVFYLIIVLGMLLLTNIK